MQMFSSALAGAALSLTLIAGAAPAQAAPMRVAPAVSTGDHSAGIQTVGDWDRRHYHNRYRGRDNFRLGFGLGFGAPFIGYPGAYAYRPYRYAYPACPYGTAFSPGYGCVATYSAYPVYPAYRYPYRYRGGYDVEYRERGY